MQGAREPQQVGGLGAQAMQKRSVDRWVRTPAHRPGESMGVGAAVVQMQKAFRTAPEEPPLPYLGAEHRPDAVLVDQRGQDRCDGDGTIELDDELTGRHHHVEGARRDLGQGAVDQLLPLDFRWRLASRRHGRRRRIDGRRFGQQGPHSLPGTPDRGGAILPGQQPGVERQLGWRAGFLGQFSGGQPHQRRGPPGGRPRVGEGEATDEGRPTTRAADERAVAGPRHWAASCSKRSVPQAVTSSAVPTARRRCPVHAEVHTNVRPRWAGSRRTCSATEQRGTPIVQLASTG